MSGDRPLSVVVGTGYAGERILHALPIDKALGLSRSPLDRATHSARLLDLDRRSEQAIVLTPPYTIVYTVPPLAGAAQDERLRSFLSRIEATPDRIVYLSSSGVYGDRRGEITRETDPLNPATDRSMRRQAAELLLQQWCEQQMCELTVLRVAGIYGPGRLGLDRLRNGQAILSEAASGPANRIHVDDLVACCIAAMSESAPPGTYNIADGDHRSSSWFTRTAARLAGLPAPPEIGLEEAARLWSTKRLYFLSESRRLDTQKMRTVLGVTPRDAEDGIRASLGTDSD